MFAAYYRAARRNAAMIAAVSACRSDGFQGVAAVRSAESWMTSWTRGNWLWSDGIYLPPS
jgi:hypothetical protein